MDIASGIVVATIISIAPILTVLVTWLQQKKKIEQVHMLVNSRLSEALTEIKELKVIIRQLRAEPERPEDRE